MSEIRVNNVIADNGLDAVNFSKGINVSSGIITATSFSGSGANLTTLPAANLTGTLPAISGANLTGLSSGLSMADQWRVNTNFTSANTAPHISSNWERNDTSFSVIGSGMSESSGIFTFPETGIYKVDWSAMGSASGTQVRYIVADIGFTTNGSSFASNLAFGNGSISNDSVANSQTHASCIFDVTNTSTHKVRFTVYAEFALTWECNSTANSTYATFIRLGDT